MIYIVEPTGVMERLQEMKDNVQRAKAQGAQIIDWCNRAAWSAERLRNKRS